MLIEGSNLKTITDQNKEKELTKIDIFMRNPKLAFSKSFDLNTKNSTKLKHRPIGTITIEQK